MNKVIKILLSVLIVSLSALVVPLVGHSANVKTDPVAVQAIVVESTENRDYEVIELSEVSINFEIDSAIEEMNQKMDDIESVEDKKE